jgi:hypothetical protein
LWQQQREGRACASFTLKGFGLILSDAQFTAQKLGGEMHFDATDFNDAVIQFVVFHHS